MGAEKPVLSVPGGWASAYRDVVFPLHIPEGGWMPRPELCVLRAPLYCALSGGGARARRLHVFGFDLAYEYPAAPLNNPPPPGDMTLFVEPSSRAIEHKQPNFRSSPFICMGIANPGWGGRAFKSGWAGRYSPLARPPTPPKRAQLMGPPKAYRD